MFIYAGLIAAIAMASQPVPTFDQSPADPVLRPVIVEVPMQRSDI